MAAQLRRDARDVVVSDAVENERPDDELPARLIAAIPPLAARALLGTDAMERPLVPWGVR
jgi:hypothetical protein